MTVDVHTLSGAYALDALSTAEAAEFRRHLAGCPACRDEVRELRDAAARMGAGVATSPPNDLRRRILEAADRTAQLPPTRATPSASAPRSIDSAPSRRWQRWVASAAAAVVLGGGGAVGVRAVLDGADEPRLSAAAASVFGAEDARTASVDTANGGTLVVGVSADRGEMAVDTRELPALDEEHVYQVWTLTGEVAASAAVVEDLSSGAAMALPVGETQVAVTVEPAGGSEQPTTDPIVIVDPTAV